MLIDTHAHLGWESFKEDFEEVIDRASLAGVQTIINIGADLQSSHDAAKLECSKVKCYSTIGLHPDEILKLSTDVSIQQNIVELEKIYHTYPDKVIAVGECGLDYFLGEIGEIRDIREMNSLPELKLGVSSSCLKTIKERQIKLFQAQISLAKKLNLPLIVHCRDAWEGIPWNELQNLPVVFHYFTGSLKDAQKIIENGFFLSFSCVVTYPKNEALREILKVTPLDKILTETDSPFSPPQTKRGQRNEPANVVEVVKVIAQVKNLPFEEVAQKTYENANKLFNLEALGL